MQTKKILILLAVEEELGAENITALSPTHALRLMGVGKLRAYEATLRALREDDYDVVINLGTCGSFRHPYATLLKRINRENTLLLDIYLFPRLVCEKEVFSVLMCFAPILG